MAYDKSNARPNRKSPKKACALCVEKAETIDY